ncbi:metal-dependent hydrolase [Sphingomonas sabuli]|uniref:Metal-dependent hydrolase n=1 Tax=Sphingomonas sabuli TaxID=2764186 RepID=A0A7G9L207_9SPHN|nr:metal-dependent hydrolase [Sphingomonas sabuli]QNM82656.1 metal-dependent hydrolase [Sphingomonas sabuli]
MDNLTHSMAGWVLGQAGLKTESRKGLAALILGANMPDIDVFFGWVPWEPLSIHRGFTHGLVGGVLVMPPILAGLLLLLDRWQVGRGTVFRSGLEMRPWRLLALCYVGAITHPMLDVLTTYSVQLLSPFSSGWYHSDGLFIIDLWIWLFVGGAIFWSKRREKRGGAWRTPARTAIAVTLVYIAANLAISARAGADVRAWAGQRPVDAIFASPPPFYPWRRDMVWREAACYRRASYSPVAGLGSVGGCEPTGLDDPLVRRTIAGSASLHKFLKWSILPQARVERSGCDARVYVGDARYGPPGQSRLARETTLKTC